MVKDSVTNESFRADHLIEAYLKEKNQKPELFKFSSPTELDELIAKHQILSPTTGNKLTPSSEFNLMFQTQFGPSSQQKWYVCICLYIYLE